MSLFNLDTIQLTAQKLKLPIPRKEYRFDSGRKWRIDYAFVKQKIAVEIEGAVWSRGRHVRPQGFLKDIEKYNKLTERGWRLLRYATGKIDWDQLTRVIYTENNNMREYKFSSVSLRRLETCHQDIQKIFARALQKHIMDIAIISGYRNEQEQEEAFKKGRSALHFPQSIHNHFPSFAVDAAEYMPNLEGHIDWGNIESYKNLRDLIYQTTQELLAEKEVSHEMDKKPITFKNKNGEKIIDWGHFQFKSVKNKENNDE